MNELKVMVVSASVFPKHSGSAIVMENLVRRFNAKQMTVVGELGPFTKPISRSISSPKFFYCKTRLTLAGRGARFLASIRRCFLPYIVRRITNIAERERCEAILGVYPDELYLHAAYLASRKMHLPFFSYFHNTFVDNIALDTARARSIQEKVFADSRKVFVMSEGMKSFFEEKYPNIACTPIVHTFESYPPEETQPFSIPLEKPTKVVMFGNFNESNLEATIRLCNALKSQSDVEMHIYSDVPSVLLEHRGIPMKSVNHQGSLGHLAFNEMIAELRKYDIIALTHGFYGGYGINEYRTIFPTRTIPMLVSGRPIIVHSPSDSYLTKFAQNHQIGMVVDSPSDAMICDAVRTLIGNKQLVSKYIANSLKSASQFHVSKVVELFVNELRLGVGDKS